MINHLKLLLSELGHKGNFIKSDEIINSLNTKGFHYIPDFIIDEELKLIKDVVVDLYSNDDLVKIESNGFDKRIYGADERANFAVPKLNDKSNPLYSKFSFTSNPFHFLLLGWITSGKGNLGSGGGWHRDSPFAHQFKTILYLTDVTEDNGPFQFVEGSNNWRNNLSVAKALGKSLSDYRFTNDDIELLVKKGVIKEPQTFTSKAGGLIIADTRGLHRGKPIEVGERLAVTRYHFHKDVRSKFYK
ncbi:hypothetical protein JCM19298_1494 [Nonlabens ulvanivorans]|nr:phytanoyl-CoA dioxygenase family protein [Nonlabens ulvanivorans]GAK94366.1 hypothetical protein JCM19298_1494 [Nonlabens ulvanivorans]